MKIAVDFDGTIAKRNGIPTISQNTEDLEPMEGSRQTMQLLLDIGYEVYIFTNHEPIKEVNDWLEMFDFPDGIKVTNIKQPDTNVYIDDRAIRFTNWQDIRKYFA